MPGPLTKLRRRVEKTAAGTQPPAGIETVPAGPHRAGPREKLALRRRLRELRDARQRLIFELGALTFEQYRRNRPDGALLGRKAGQAVAVDTEMETLAAALGKRRAPVELPIEGIATPCTHCGSMVTGPARFCSACGNPLVAAAAAPATPPAPSAPPPEQPAVAVEQPPVAAEQPTSTAQDRVPEDSPPAADGAETPDGAESSIGPRSPSGPQSPADPPPPGETSTLPARG